MIFEENGAWRVESDVPGEPEHIVTDEYDCLCPEEGVRKKYLKKSYNNTCRGIFTVPVAVFVPIPSSATAQTRELVWRVSIST